MIWTCEKGADALGNKLYRVGGLILNERKVYCIVHAEAKDDDERGHPRRIADAENLWGARRAIRAELLSQREKLAEDFLK